MSTDKTLKIRLDTSGILLFFLGVAALIVSIVYTSLVLAFIGLGLTFWGAILSYIHSDEYVKGSLLSATATPLLSTLNQTLDELDYNGKPVYLPPKYLNAPDESKVYIPKSTNSKLPTPEQVQTLENQTPSRDQQGLLLTPPGAELARLFEKTLGTTFTRTDLNYLVKNMPKLVVEGLEIATDLEITPETAKPAAQTESVPAQHQKGLDKIHVKITDSIYEEMDKQVDQMARIHGNIGCPLTSALACAIAKSTGTPTIIADEKTSDDGRTKEVDYYTYEEE
ncbi:MAG: hypothetical protein ABSG57_13000 [Candidatus Bathyarchaeia archaeon]